MFLEMRSAANIPPDKDILDYVHSLSEREQAEAFAAIQAIERRAMATQTPQPGLVALMEYLDRKDIRKAICTRNFDAPVENFLEKHLPCHLKPFEPIITRDFRPPKPSPAGILHIAHSWGIVDSASIPNIPRSKRLLPLVMVGDSIDDMISGHEAGALTVLLKSEGKEALESDATTDVVISR
jgi:phosphoglycolate phosphatase-like HAD superfamily hydrolase